ncbi:MAG: ribosome maturation factor RimM [Thermodesulfobacteriota bacterium]|nr:MAG: ribosome maturation factor RimM [Thermodesulfobacteriota bacterium]
MNKEEEDIIVGRITGLHGLRGEVKFHPFGDMEVFQWKTLFIEEKGRKKALNVEGARRHKKVFLLILEGYTSRESSGVLVGADVTVPKEEIPKLPEGEYYYSELEGLEVLTDGGKHVGYITEIISTGASDVISVGAEGGAEILIALTAETIKEVDLEGKKIIVGPLEDLLPE